MKLGLLLPEEYANKLIAASHAVDTTPLELIQGAIDVLYRVAVGEDDE